ncbi:MAG TPA: phage baseplate assembly protein V [Azonexus sp.]|nr:phage baseplate assembly protein V [Azonexus sp.]
MREFARLLAPYARQLGNLLARGTVAAVNAASKMQAVQLRLLASEVKDNLEHFEPYGFTSNPKSGAEALAMFFDGDRSHGVCFMVADRRFRLVGLQAGEMAIHDDQGQKVHLTRAGIVIDGGGLPLTIQNAPTMTFKAATKIRMETLLLEVTGDIKDNCGQSYGRTMYAMRVTYNGHTHHENDVHGETNNPTQQM